MLCYGLGRIPLFSACTKASCACGHCAQVLLVLCYGLGFIPCWRDPTNDLGVHMLNGFVLIGLMGFGMTLADLFSSRR